MFWTLTEYWLHRIVFHFEPEKGIGARLHWIIHGVHHDHPNDPMRLVMPPALSVPLAAVFVYGFYLVIGSPGFLPFGAAFLAGYLGYDMLHYHVHHHRPKTALGKRLRELHMRHHFQNHERGYGVSAPFWDHVFGTAPKKIDPLARARSRDSGSWAWGRALPASRWRSRSGSCPTSRSPRASGSMRRGSPSGPAPASGPGPTGDERLSELAADAGRAALERAGVDAARARSGAGRDLDRRRDHAQRRDRWSRG